MAADERFEETDAEFEVAAQGVQSVDGTQKMMLGVHLQVAVGTVLRLLGTVQTGATGLQKRALSVSTKGVPTTLLFGPAM